MPDTFTTTTRTSYGSRLGSSVKGIFGGIIVFQPFLTISALIFGSCSPLISTDKPNLSKS